MVNTYYINKVLDSNSLNQNMLYAFLVLMIVFISVLIIKKLINNYYSNKLKNSTIHEIDSMDGFQFEQYLSVLFKGDGYRVNVTKSRGDFGADLILNKGSKTIAIQAKRYAKPVGIKAVQEVIASIPYYQADEGWVVCTNSFTKSAEELATAAKNINLIDKDQLVNLVLKMNPDAHRVAKNTLQNVKPKKIRCPTCRGEMSVKSGKYGRFYGCDNYPGCKTTKKLGNN